MDDPPHIGPDRIQNDDHRHREEDARFVALRAAVQRGLDDVAAGRVVDVDEAFDRVEAMLDEMEAAKRA